MWKAELRIGSVRAPVKLYAAVQDRDVHFRLLHEKDRTPVAQEMVRADTEEPVPSEEVNKAVQVERGVFVVITEEDEEKLAPKPSRDIEVERVVPRAGVDLRWFDRPYYLAPDGDADAYFAIAQELDDRGAIAVARWVMRGRRYTGALHARDGYLVLETMRYADELLDIPSVEPPAGRKPDSREMKLAEQLIASLEDDFDPAAYRDEHRDKVMGLLEAKKKGKVVRMPKAKTKHAEGSLMEQLKASIGGSRGR